MEKNISHNFFKVLYSIFSQYTTRRNGFPHPLQQLPLKATPVQEVDEHLCGLRSFRGHLHILLVNQSHKLSGLQDLHDCIDRLLQLPLTQQDLAHN
ncbi:unnamed protein product [Prunus armeniaca]